MTGYLIDLKDKGWCIVAGIEVEDWEGVADLFMMVLLAGELSLNGGEINLHVR